MSRANFEKKISIRISSDELDFIKQNFGNTSDFIRSAVHKAVKKESALKRVKMINKGN